MKGTNNSPPNRHKKKILQKAILILWAKVVAR